MKKPQRDFRDVSVEIVAMWVLLAVSLVFSLGILTGWILFGQ